LSDPSRRRSAEHELITTNKQEFDMSRPSIARPGSTATIAALAACLFGSQTAWSQTGPRPAHGVALQPPRLQVNVGSQAAAEAYYKTVLSPQAGFLSDPGVLTSNVGDLLNYLGYSTLTAKDLHRLSSDELAAAGSAGEIVATRFFAPKITDVSDKPNPNPVGGFGWRKLVRFKSRTGSIADQRGIESAFFLQNIFEKDVSADPFDAADNVSINNQVILVRRGLATQFGPSNRAAYFITYGPLVVIDADKKPVRDAGGNFQDDGKITTQLLATFDEHDRDPETNSEAQDYFVPDSCVQCHGASSARGKLNVLDTDHWFDRVSPNYGVTGGAAFYGEEDFTALATSPFGVLYDGGKDQSKPKFATAFDAIRRINDEIKTQNEQAGGTTFQLDSARKWGELHAVNTAHVPPYQRGFGTAVWNETDQLHRKSLYFANRYCYRCHSSIRFNVFDMQSVKDRIEDIKVRTLIVDPISAGRWMPQDRIIPGLTVDPITGEGKAGADLKEFHDLLDALDAQ